MLYYITGKRGKTYLARALGAQEILDIDVDSYLPASGRVAVTGAVYSESTCQQLRELGSDYGGFRHIHIED